MIYGLQMSDYVRFVGDEPKARPARAAQALPRRTWWLALRLPCAKPWTEARKRSLKKLVDRGIVPGLLGYRDGRPVGWVSLGPRDDYARLARSPVMKPVDDKPVWSIVCFVVDPSVRHQGVAAALLRGGLDWARDNGIKLVEAYPVDKDRRSGDDSMWFGAKRMYDAAGFVEVARPKPTRAVVRKSLRGSRNAMSPRI